MGQIKNIKLHIVTDIKILYITTMPEYSNYHSPDDDTVAKLFVGGLSWNSNEESIKAYFEKFGPVQEVALKKNREDPTKHRGFCFVKFTTQESADDVLSQQEPHYIDGMKVDAKSVCPPGVKPETRTKKLFVGGLQQQLTEEVLTEYFSKFGRITSKIEFPLDRNTQKRRGFCFIEFASESVVDRIVNTQYHQIAGAQVETKRVLSKQQQAEEAIRRASASATTHPMGVIQTMPGGVPAAALGYGAGLQQVYGQQQPIMYVLPEQLAGMYSQYGIPAAGGVYQHAPTAGIPMAVGGTAYTSALETLYQPYTAAAMAQNVLAKGGVSTSILGRQAPYPVKKKY